jgi:hypothetical protein
MNPFIKTQTFAQAGLFVAVGPQSSTGNIAEKICSALSEKVAENKMPLDQSWWEQCVSTIPNQVDAMLTSKTASTKVSGEAIAAEIASLSLPAITVAAPKKTATSQISSYIESLPTLTSFNCLVVSALDKSKITLSLSFYTISQENTSNGTTDSYEIIVNRSFTIIDMTSTTNAKQINEIFDSFSPITGQDYYVSIQQKQPALQNN